MILENRIERSMHIFLRNVIPHSLIEEALQLYDENNQSDNKKFSEYRIGDSNIPFALTKFLHEVIVEEVAKKWVFTKYKFINLRIRKFSTGSFQKRHVDFFAVPLNHIYLNFYITLNDNFEGGEIILENEDRSKIAFEVTKGYGLLFESTSYREVFPITSGERFSLIGQFIGKL